MSDKTEEQRAIIVEIAALEPGVPSETDGDISCYFCNAWIGLGDSHTAECLWVRAKACVD